MAVPMLPTNPVLRERYCILRWQVPELLPWKSLLQARRDIRMHLPGRKIAPDKTVLLFQSCGHKAAALQEHSAEADPRL